MADKRLLDRDTQPDADTISALIGREVLPVWDDVNAYLTGQFPQYEAELFFYNPQHGWAIRYRNESQQLCMLFPERGGFTALVMLNPEEEALALGKVNYFNSRLRELLNSPSTLPQGRWLWMRLEDHTDFVGFKLLMEIKQV
jgi:hypothetical protein